ncbi:MAG: SH3 domain-containing protein, partial [Clostridiales bacterium]|nr:SH3 domain-containing protein [Clostridiales bacterium]
SSTLKLRSRKSTDSIVVVELEKGNKLEVLDESADWLKVNFDGYTGYVMKEFVKISGGKTPSATKNDGTLRPGDTGQEVKELQNQLKEKGYLDGKADGSYGKQTEEAVRSFQKENNLTADGIAGAMTLHALQQAQSKKTSTSNSQRSTISRISDIGTTPGTSKPGDSGTYVKKLQQALAFEGYYVGSIDGSFGNGTEEAVKSFQKAKGMSQDGIAGTVTITLLFGEKPSDTSSTIKNNNQEIEKKAEKTIETPTNGSAADGITTIGDIGAIPGTSKPGDKSTNVKKLQQALALKGFYKGDADGVFGSGTEAAVKSFQKAKGMSQDGIAGTVTITLLFGEKPSDTSSTVNNKNNQSEKQAGNESNKKIATENLDWFNGGNTAIPKGAVFTIKDVASGATFQAKRWSGGNHMDVEPVSQEDAETMKSIYGGSWSWKRRAILMKYNGHVYAGSMNGMEHGDDTISGNGMKGHFCIHMKNSKTHGSEKVDQEHQNMVAKAAKATW